MAAMPLERSLGATAALVGIDPEAVTGYENRCSGEGATD
jgi:hypothetical protein